MRCEPRPPNRPKVLVREPLLEGSATRQRTPIPTPNHLPHPLRETPAPPGVSRIQGRNVGGDHNERPPKAGFAPREAHKEKSRPKLESLGRLLKQKNRRPRPQGGGSWGNQGFPHVLLHHAAHVAHAAGHSSPGAGLLGR